MEVRRFSAFALKNYVTWLLVVDIIAFRFRVHYPTYCFKYCIFTARCTIVQSAVLRSHVVRLSVCNVGGSGPHGLEILETKCTNN